MGVSTWERLEYLQRFVESFTDTRSDRFRWALVVADDGSTDGTIEYLKELSIPECQLVVILNKAATVSGQANSILLAAEALSFDFGIKCDDDVFFTARGWDSLYYDAAFDTGKHHLVYHNPEWKPPSHSLVANGLRSSVPAREAMGCLYTFTPEVLEAVGYMDEISFPVRGHSHVDFTVRCCRAGFNDETTLWDADGSTESVGMWDRGQYQNLVDWNSPEMRQLFNEEERARRAAVIDDQHRIYIPALRADPSSPRSVARATPHTIDVEESLVDKPRFRVLSGPSAAFDGIFVLNLAQDVARWAVTAEALSRHHLLGERFAGVDGNSEQVAEEWRQYASSGLILPEERMIGRKLIQSPGAWAYLRTMEQLIEHAQARRLGRILVLDDDILVHKDFETVFHEAWAELPRSWDLVHLGCSQMDWGVARDYSKHLYHPRGAATGSFAFALDSSAFPLVLDEVRKRDAPFDSGALRRVEEANPRGTFAVRPDLIIADVGTSSIRPPRDLQVFSKEVGWAIDHYEQRSFAQSPTEPVGRHRLPRGGLVSVLMVCQDDEGAVAAAVSSLRSQTHGNFELLVIDNGSTDRTPDTLDALRTRDSRMQVFYLDEPADPVECLNLLLSRAEGEFITVTDPNEVSFPDRLERCLAAHASGEGQWVRAGVIGVRHPPPGDLDDPGLLMQWAESRRVGATQLAYRVGLTRREVFEIAGAFLASGEPGVEELIRRTELVTSIAEDIAAFRGVDDLAEAVALSWGDRAQGATRSDWARFHSEIQRGIRPAFVAGSPQSLRPRVGL